MVKDLPANAGDIRDAGSIPGFRRSPGGGNGNPLQYSCRKNPKDGEAWQATVHGVINSQIRLSIKQFIELTGSLKREGSSEPIPANRHSWVDFCSTLIPTPPKLGLFLKTL